MGSVLYCYTVVNYQTLVMGGDSPQTPLPGQLNEDILAKMTPSEALTALLTSAQADHRKCVTKALIEKEDPVDKCSLTWGNVLLRYQQFGSYRAPFDDEVAEKAYHKFWTKKRQTAADNAAF
eukprot:GILI01011203.1.p1 GENE.GILI01011203.1~~GILI01011203.1.p1  ORF type:complete len:122 (-),score=40.02 GILI01011203.1:141-506(-)